MSDGLLHADIAAVYDMAGYREAAPSAATITRIRAAEDQRDAADREVTDKRTIFADVPEVRRRAAEIVRQYVGHFRNSDTRHLLRPRTDGKLPPPYPRPDPWRTASSAAVLFAAHPATAHELSPTYTLDDIVATRPVEFVRSGTLPTFPCDWRGPKCGPAGCSSAVVYLAVPDGQCLVLFGLCSGCEGTIADLARRQQ
jgi:hypothetical protein